MSLCELPSHRIGAERDQEFVAGGRIYRLHPRDERLFLRKLTLRWNQRHPVGLVPVSASLEAWTKLLV